MTMLTHAQALPVDAILDDVIASLRNTPNLVVEAPPGAGKTTRVPPALLKTTRGDILVLEPRRIAARLAARRVAQELGQEIGETVGYQVRFEDVSGPRTRLRFLTEGVLTRRFLSDPRVEGVGAVVLDEFHERHLEGDLALALLKRLQATERPDLEIVVMSATLETDPVAEYLGRCPILRSEGRLFDLTITHLPYSAEPLHKQVSSALERLLKEQRSGHVLVFLPGAAEIRRAASECDPISRRAGFSVLPLYGDLPPEEQDRAVAPASGPKVILSTNIAESSITIDGVTAVIDSGLARIPMDSPWTGLPTLNVARVSKASATQRAGRAGRTAPGRVLRLYPADDYQRRPDHDAPEIVRRELSQLCLDLRSMGLNAADLEWLEPPPDAALERAEALLNRLGATGKVAARMARYPLHPRLSRLVLEAVDRGVGEDGCVVAALLGSGARLDRTDLLAALDSEWDYRVRQHVEQLRRIVRPRKQTRHDDQAMLMSVLTGFPDRVARRRKGNQVLLCTGVSAELAGDAPAYEFMVAVDIEDRGEKPLPLVRLTARIEPEWLVDLFPDRVRERAAVEWNRAAERVEAVSALLYDELVIEESRGAAPDAEQAAELLAAKASEAAIERFVDAEELREFLARVDFAGLTTPDPHAVLRQLSTGLRSFAELKNAASGFLALMEQRVDARLLNELAPARIRLPGGRYARVHYERGKPPWVASRLQDFFGMREAPRVGRDRTPLVVHLLAPNHRPVQMTTDLAGFWDRLYPQVRRELSRRYPKHAWPERP